MMARKTSLSRIRLELARTADFPSGSAWHGYEFVAPLTEDGLVDPEAWNKSKELCHVRRFWDEEPEEAGQFVHSGNGWCFRYPRGSKIEKETLYKLDRHRFTPGGYVTVTEPDGEQLPFRIVALTPVLLAN